MPARSRRLARFWVLLLPDGTMTDLLRSGVYSGHDVCGPALFKTRKSLMRFYHLDSQTWREKYREGYRAVRVRVVEEDSNAKD